MAQDINAGSSALSGPSPSSTAAGGSAPTFLASDDGMTAGLALDPPRIAVYEAASVPPRVITVTEENLPALVQTLAGIVEEATRSLGGQIPALVIRELVENLVHAGFQGVVVTILEAGNTLRISDKGPGIRDKDAALRPGFSSADPRSKQLIRGVGSGFSLVSETLATMGGTLEIEDNLLGGTVVTVRVPPLFDKPLAPERVATYNLSERQLKALLLALELAPVGPTRIARELGISTSTAYRDLLSLEEAGLVLARPTGHRSVTEAGLAFVEGALGDRV
jgi:anti-sigma regulatory factor (Ser/Thr protein kinase)